jgi:antimicrobial peptide system SdpA family protein
MALSVVVVVGFLGGAAFYSLPSNVLSTRSPQDQVRLAFNVLASEDYGFFTKNPQSDALRAFHEVGGSVYDVTTTPQNKPTNLFGLSRTQRAQGPELANISDQKSAAWVACPTTKTESDCITAAFRRHAASVQNSSPVRTVCGDIVLADEVPVPWSYRKLVAYDRKVLQTVHLQIRCAT